MGKAGSCRGQRVAQGGEEWKNYVPVAHLTCARAEESQTGSGWCCCGGNTSEQEGGCQ